MALKAIILVGSPCSGKTTYALSKEFAGMEYIGVDGCFDSVEDVIEHIDYLLYKGKSFIIDSCNATEWERSIFIKAINEFPFNKHELERCFIECHVLNVDISQSIENGKLRQLNGGKRLNLFDLLYYYKKFDRPKVSEGFHLIKTWPFESLKKDRVLVNA